MKLSFLTVLSLLYIISCQAQTTGSVAVDLPTILPASPEPSSFVKAGVGIVNLSTGMASANIDLYDIKIRDFKLPISLSYSTQGLKADEASSRVGLGWLLNANGVITRSVKGKIDEQSQHQPPPANFSLNTNEVFSYCINGSDPNSVFDDQPDEFQFNFNGYSGKFVLDGQYVARVTSTSNLKIAVTAYPSNSSSGYIGSIVITAPDGVIYRFGTTFETTTTHNIQPFVGFKDRTVTSYFLDRIDLPNGDWVLFHYSPIHTRVSVGLTQTYKLSSGGGACVTCSSFNSYSSNVNRIEYNTDYLSSITTSNGLSVTFFYEARPDLSYDNRINGMQVDGPNGGIKKYLFSYYDVPGSSNPSTAPDVIGRFFLTRLREVNPLNGSDTSKKMDYTFSYDRMDQVPLPIVGNQDYYGFWRGGVTGNQPGSLIPQSTNSSGQVDLSFREPVSDYAKIGTLTNIRYPTGGSETYTYEPNTIPTQVKRNTFVTQGLEGNGSTTSVPVFTSGTFTVKRDQTATLSSYSVNYNLNDPYVADPAHKTVVLNVHDGSTVIASGDVLGYGPHSWSVNLTAGHSYYITMAVWDSHVRGYESFYYDTSSADIYDNVNKRIPGVRVKQITFTDPLTNSTHSKYYTYAALNNLAVSSGASLGVNFYSNEMIRSYCPTSTTDCSVDVYSSSSTNDVYGYSGSGGVIYYNTVTESDDPGFQNGGTEYDFFPNDDGGNKSILLGKDIVNLPTGQFPTQAGTLFKKKIFDRNFQVVRQEQNDYETLIDLSNAVSSYYVRDRYTVNFSYPDWMDAFDVAKLLYGNYWIRLKTKTVTQYSGANAWTSVTNYTYGTAANILPSVITTSDSKGLELRTESKYPTDFTSDQYYNLLTSQNIISPVVMENHYRNGNLIQQKQTWYYDWFGNGKIVTPLRIQVKLSPNDVLHDAIVFNRYDRTGSVQQLQKANDMSLVYLWDSVYVLPVCQVKNAGFDQVAFCNFEQTGQWGNWQVTTGGVSSTAALSGSYSFSGTLTKNLVTSGQYTVSAWTNSSVTVNGASGTLLTSYRGWNLYEWTLTNPGSVTVQGTNVDDVRLYPKDAQMTTYTYQPFTGVTSQCDPDNRFSYYQYDMFGRLKVVYDQDGNIIKTVDYHYNGQ